MLFFLLSNLSNTFTGIRENSNVEQNTLQ